MNILKTLVLSFFCLVSAHAFSEAVYDASTGVVTIPVVTVGNIYVYEARLKLANDGRWDLIGYSLSPPAPAVSDTCTSSNITLEKYNQVSFGMTYEQASAILGCAGELTVEVNSGGYYGANYQFVAGFKIITMSFLNNSLQSKGKSGL